MDNVSLHGAVALVTGASSGIGAEIAQRLAACGATVALLARRAERLTAIADTITAAGGTAVTVAADTTDAARIRTAVDELAASHGLDLLVDSAGWGKHAMPEDGELADWHQMVDVNFTGTLNCVHAALPHLLASPREARDLVLISSVSGRIPRSNNAVYSATKHAVNAFAEGLRQTVTARGLRVGLVEPGVVSTDLTADNPYLPDGFTWLRPTDVADAVEYMVTRPPHAAVNEIMVRATGQES